MNAGYCWTCHADHPAEFQTCSEARLARVHALAEAARAELQAIERCSHKVPRSHCAEHPKQVDA